MKQLFQSGVNTPLGSLIHQTFLTEMAVLLVKSSAASEIPFLEEFICTFQTAAIRHELGIIKKVYGPLPFSVALFCVSILYAVKFSSRVQCNPTTSMHKFSAEKRMTVLELALHIAVQTSACLASHLYIKWVWSTEVWNLFLVNWDPLYPCTTDIKVPISAGIFAEAFLTFLSKLFLHARCQMPFGVIFCSLIGVALSFAGVPFTGGYCNPSMAFSLKYGCKGQSDWEFFLVYVMGPTIGAFLSGIYADALWKRILPHQEHHDKHRYSRPMGSF